MPGRLALYYTSYKLGNPDIFYHNLTTGQRRVVAGYSGSEHSPAVSPDGSKVAMILSRSGSPDVWVCNADGSNLKQLTTTQRGFVAVLVAGRAMDLFRDENRTSAACWPKCRRAAGRCSVIPTAGAPNPTEPDWSPDGKWIAFTSQTGEFDICVMPADGSTPPTVLVRGRGPVVVAELADADFQRGAVGGRYMLSVLDVFTKQVKDIAPDFGQAIPNRLGRNDLNFLTNF